MHSKTFDFKNSGQVPATFAWSCPRPFTLTPRAGSIEAGKSKKITCRFSPDSANVWESQAVCTINGREQRVLQARV